MKKTKGDFTKEKVLREAARLFHERGFGATSINDIVAATGLKKGSLYFHFPGKDALALAILEKAKESFLEFVAQSLSGPTPGERLRSFFSNVLEMAKTTGLERGCIFGNTALEMGHKDPRYGKIIGEVFGEWRERLRKVIEEAQQTGEVRDDLPAHALARHLVSTIEGNIMLARVEKNEKAFADSLAALKTLVGLRE